MKRFHFKYEVGTLTGIFDVDAKSSEVAFQIATLMAEDRTGQKNVRVQLVSTEDWV